MGRPQEPVELLRNIISEDIWLNYYNDYAYEHGAISHKEWLKMKLAITLETQRRRKEALAAFQIEPQVQ